MNTGSNLFTLGQGEGVAEKLLEFGCAHGIRTERKSLPGKIKGLPVESVGLQALSHRQSLLRKHSLPGMATAEIASICGLLCEWLLTAKPANALKLLSLSSILSKAPDYLSLVRRR
jgi:hypothetical protein